MRAVEERAALQPRGDDPVPSYGNVSPQVACDAVRGPLLYYIIVCLLLHKAIREQGAPARRQVDAQVHAAPGVEKVVQLAEAEPHAVERLAVINVAGVAVKARQGRTEHAGAGEVEVGLDVAVGREGVGDAEVEIQGQVGGVLLVEAETALDAEARAEKEGESHGEVEFLGVAFAAVPFKEDAFAHVEEILQRQVELPGDGHFAGALVHGHQSDVAVETAGLPLVEIDIEIGLVLDEGHAGLAHDGGEGQFLQFGGHLPHQLLVVGLAASQAEVGVEESPRQAHVALEHDGIEGDEKVGVDDDARGEVALLGVGALQGDGGEGIAVVLEVGEQLLRDAGIVGQVELFGYSGRIMLPEQRE